MKRDELMIRLSIAMLRWGWCPHAFPDKAQLESHLLETHIRPAEKVATADLRTWQGQGGRWYGHEKGFGRCGGCIDYDKDFVTDDRDLNAPTETQMVEMEGRGNSTRDSHSLSEGSSKGTIRPEVIGEFSRSPLVNLTTAEEQAFMESFLRSPSPSGNTPPRHSSGSNPTATTAAVAEDKTSSRTNATDPNASHSSRPQTQQVPLDPDTTVSSPGSTRIAPGPQTNSQQTESPVRSQQSQQSRDSGTIPASYPHETVPPILPSPPPKSKPVGVEASTTGGTIPAEKATVSVSTTTAGATTASSRTVYDIRNESRLTPLKPSSGSSSTTTTSNSNSTSTGSSHSPITSRFEFGKVVHESPQGEPLPFGQKRVTHGVGDIGSGSPGGSPDLSKRVQAAVGYPIGRSIVSNNVTINGGTPTPNRSVHSSESTLTTPMPMRPLKRKAEGEGDDDNDNLERERERTRRAMELQSRSGTGVRFGFGQGPATAPGPAPGEGQDSSRGKK
jgi:hypothetical protein